MSAVYKREMRAYFTTFTGYVYVATFLVLSGAAFIYTTLSMGSDGDYTTYYSLIMMLFAVLVPLLTMKSFADEKRLKTEALLLTSPVSLFSVVFAKFLAAFTVFAATLAVSSVNLIPMYLYGAPNTAILLGNLFSVFLIGSAFVSIGIFMSSITENQLVAAITTIATIVLFLAVGMFSSGIGFAPLRFILDFLSIFNRFTLFTYGYFDYSALVYYCSVAAVFLFLTVRVYESKRWS